MAQINYQNLPNTTTPLNATNLNAMQDISDRGSNENGSYIKYDDGIMICYATIYFTGDDCELTNSYGGVYYHSAKSYTYPVEFASRPVVLGTGKVRNALGGFNLANQPTTTGFSGYVYCYASRTFSDNDVSLQYIAIGRWR